MHETAVNREAFAGNDAGLTTLLDNFLKQHAVNVALAKPAIEVLREGRMIRHSSFQSQPAEPAIGQVKMHLIVQLPLGTNAIGVANEQHPQHQFRINRGAAFRAVMPGQNRPRLVKFEYRVKLAQRVIGRNVVLQPELIKQLLLRTLPSHHHPLLRYCAKQMRSQPNLRYNYFFNTIYPF
jgi:hypothetical protein